MVITCRDVMLAEQAATETSAAEVGVVTSADLFRFCLFLLDLCALVVVEGSSLSVDM